MYVLDERPANDDYSKETAVFTLSEDAKSNDEEYKFEKLGIGRYFYLARNTDAPVVDKILELVEIFVYGLPVDAASIIRNQGWS